MAGAVDGVTALMTIPRGFVCWVGFALLVAGAIDARRPAAAVGMHPRELLRTVAQFSDAEWSAVERGEPVAKVLDTDAREVAVAGAVRIAGSREAFVSRWRDLANLRFTSVVLDVGPFSATPGPQDLQRVSFEDRSLDLRSCRPGDCPVRLSATDIARFHREVNWNGADWRTRSAAVWKDVLAGYAAGYLKQGRAALPDYVNKREALSVAAEVSLLLDAYTFVESYSPELQRYLRDFGPRAPAGTEHLLYWTREDFGIRPIVRISHQVIHRAPGASGAIIVATNQVYADHYLDAALTVTLALDAGTGFHMISVSRARTRSLSGFLRRMVRSTVQTRSREAMRKLLAGTKMAIEKTSH